MSVETLPAPVGSRVDDINIDHLVCCDPNRARCGQDVTDEPWVPPDPGPDDCVVCESLQGTPCGVPGCEWGGPS